MKRHKKEKLFVSIISMTLVGSLMAFMAKAENDFFQFCTTKAYGWPLPWKIDHCLCEKGASNFPVFYIIVNIGVVFGFGIVAFLLTGFVFQAKEQNH